MVHPVGIAVLPVDARRAGPSADCRARGDGYALLRICRPPGRLPPYIPVPNTDVLSDGVVGVTLTNESFFGIPIRTGRDTAFYVSPELALTAEHVTVGNNRLLCLHRRPGVPRRQLRGTDARRDPAPAQTRASSGSSKALSTLLAVVLGLVVLVFYFRARAGESYSVQVTGHNAVAVFRGPFARWAGTGALAGFGQQAQEVDADSTGGGGAVCRLRHDSVSVEVRDSGVLGTSVGGALCAPLPRARLGPGLAPGNGP